LSKIFRYAPSAMSSFTASLIDLVSGEPLAVTKPTGVELIWPRNFVFGTRVAS
jgi:hypothetical protein